MGRAVETDEAHEQQFMSQIKALFNKSHASKHLSYSEFIRNASQYANPSTLKEVLLPLVQDATKRKNRNRITRASQIHHSSVCPYQRPTQIPPQRSSNSSFGVANNTTSTSSSDDDDNDLTDHFSISQFESNLQNRHRNALSAFLNANNSTERRIDNTNASSTTTTTTTTIRRRRRDESSNSNSNANNRVVTDAASAEARRTSRRFNLLRHRFGLPNHSSSTVTNHPSSTVTNHPPRNHFSVFSSQTPPSLAIDGHNNNFQFDEHQEEDDDDNYNNNDNNNDDDDDDYETSSRQNMRHRVVLLNESGRVIGGRFAGRYPFGVDNDNNNDDGVVLFGSDEE